MGSGRRGEPFAERELWNTARHLFTVERVPRIAGQKAAPTTVPASAQFRADGADRRIHAGIRHATWPLWDHRRSIMVRFPEGALTNSDKVPCPRRNRICGTERAAYPYFLCCATGSRFRIHNMAEIGSMLYCAASQAGFATSIRASDFFPLLRAGSG